MIHIKKIILKLDIRFVFTRFRVLFIKLGHFSIFNSRQSVLGIADLLSLRYGLDFEPLLPRVTVHSCVQYCCVAASSLSFLSLSRRRMYCEGTHIIRFPALRKMAMTANQKNQPMTSLLSITKMMHPTRVARTEIKWKNFIMWSTVSY